MFPISSYCDRGLTFLGDPSSYDFILQILYDVIYFLGYTVVPMT